MNNLSTLKPTFLFFFFFMLHLITIVTCAPRYTPTDDIALSCGTSGNSTSPNGRQWTGDKSSIFAPIEKSNNKSVTSTANIQESSVDMVPYMTARISRSQFMYTFPVTPGQKFIRLHFYPASYPPDFDKYNDFFTVKAGPFTLLKNFSASIYSDYFGASFFKEYCLNVEEANQQLNITFTPSFSSSNETYAFINGIEIVSMPTGLYYTSPLDNEGIRAIGQNNRSRIENDIALEMIYRLNVGGRSMSPTEDTGMYREWSEDIYFMAPVAGVVSDYSNISLNWSKIPAYTAPDEVYRTDRSMGPNSTLNIQSNMTWLLSVDHGFWHLVRLHFCEFYPEVMAVNDRRFRIYIDNKTAEEDFDVMTSSGGKEIPMYMDYAVVIENNTEEHGDYNLSITLHPNASVNGYADVLLNGIEVFKLSNHDGNLAVPNPKVRFSLAVPVPVQPSGSTAHKSKTKKTLIIAGAGSAVGLLIVLSLLCCMVIWQLRQRKRYGSNYKPSWSLADEPCQLSLAEIKAATNNFQEDLIISVGSFGNVYIGFMDEVSNIVAIKRLNPESRQGAHEFWTEIEMLSNIRHVHLVSLIGYCIDEGEMILVHDFMINGTLRHYLYDTKYDPLPWKQRLEICKGAAIGLHYLHTRLERTIIHGDVKTTNILLDDKWTAKVSDFGLYKKDKEASLVNTMVKGTQGYLDPEYARGHPLSEKSDVYSFGIVLFEVLCARKAVDMNLGEDQASFAHWARKCIDNDTFYEIIDPYLNGKIAPDCFKVFLEIAESCVNEEGIKRPTMKDVLEKLILALELQEEADAEKERTYPNKGKSSRTTTSSLPHELCRQFSLAEIKAATNNFQKRLIIGKGGYGYVFKGFMDKGSLIVAIKCLNSESSQAAREFRTEIEMLSQFRHVHLVSLIGYCNDKKEMILVYDFMTNGALRDHLYGKKNDPLSWERRLKICKGAAIGVHYLHAGSKHKIIHGDVNSANILLDEKWTAKVSDFGLSKMDQKTNLVKTKVRGTYSYLDPEYAKGHPLTEKSDVYAFGVVLFEVLCARKVVDEKLGEDKANLAHWARRCINNGTVYEMIDPYLKGKIAPACFKVFVGIAESCVHDEGIKRPTMKDVLEKLVLALELQLKANALLLYELFRQFSLDELKAATNDFNEELIIGRGRFGKVFKGSTEEGSMAVAIKRLNPESRQGASEFWTEIEMLSKCHHVHLVSLIGYCNEEGETILVYDFMINGTLRDHLYDTKNDSLPWKQRLEICKGAAIGLNYLHTGLEHTIIHRDVKTTNILLDEKLTAKVSDFGLSKIDPKTSLMNTLVKGTPGYMDPEYARGHPLTEKSDVYSFGVVLLEVLCARKAVDMKLGEDQASLAHWAIKCINDGTFYNAIDPNLMGKIAPECFMVFVGIAESCVRDEGIKRPTMNDVMEKLIFALELQEKADAEKEIIYPGGEYPAISIPVAGFHDVDGGTDTDSSFSSTSSTIDTIEMSFPSYDSRSATVLGETSNSKGP